MSADIIKYAGLVQNEKGEVLFARKHGSPTWINIGGRQQGDETPIECLRSEMREELGCEVAEDPIPTEFLRTPPTPALDDPGKTVQIIWYRLQLIGTPTARDEIDEVKWVDPSNPDVPLSPQILEYLIPALTATSSFQH